MTVVRNYPNATPDPTLPLAVPPTGVTGPAYSWFGQQITGNEGDSIVSWINGLGVGSVPLQAPSSGARPTVHIEGGFRMARFDGVNDELSPNGNQQANPVTSLNPLSTAANNTPIRRTLSMVARINQAAGSTCGLMSGGGGYMERNSANNTTSILISTPSNLQPSVAGNQTGLFKVYTMAVDLVSATTTFKIAVNDTQAEATTATRNLGIWAIGRSQPAAWGGIDVLAATYWDKYLSNAELTAHYAAMKLAYPGLLL